MRLAASTTSALGGNGFAFARLTEGEGDGLKGNSAAQLVEEYSGVFQVGGLEALSEPAVDVGEHCASLVAPVSLRQQPGQARRSAQFPPSGVLAARNLYRMVQTLLGSSASASGFRRSSSPAIR